jgi:hypothetical protein
LLLLLKNLDLTGFLFIQDALVSFSVLVVRSLSKSSLNWIVGWPCVVSSVLFDVCVNEIKGYTVMLLPSPQDSCLFDFTTGCIVMI